jgi:hypothetical protein
MRHAFTIAQQYRDLVIGIVAVLAALIVIELLLAAPLI